MLTKQEIFTKVVTGLAAQGWEQAKIHSRSGCFDTCMYRWEKDGKVLRCALGQLIPDEIYVPELEGKRLGVVAQNQPSTYPKAEGNEVIQRARSTLTAAGVGPENYDFITTLQQEHDDALDSDNMFCRFQGLCATHSLAWPPEVPQIRPTAATTAQ